MGRILGTKTTKDNKIIFEVEIDYEESLKLKGHIKNIHLFSEDAANIKSNLSQRGSKEATKYFLIPRELRENLKFDEEVKCQKIETDTRTLFIFVVNKVKI
ncbi:MAG: hypothetical protein IH845_00500 [Nanoarchaeota archaeon]|nr:hypothetical protein [Nanoarchaeota archaeon]